MITSRKPVVTSSPGNICNYIEAYTSRTAQAEQPLVHRCHVVVSRVHELITLFKRLDTYEYTTFEDGLYNVYLAKDTGCDMVTVSAQTGLVTIMIEVRNLLSLRSRDSTTATRSHVVV
jgi:hypothetical protein